MDRKHLFETARRFVVPGGLLLLIFFAPRAARAQIGGPYNLTWNVIAGGGATFLSGGSFQLGGTAGQSDTGSLSGGPYVLAGGFWHGGEAVSSVEHPNDPTLPDPTPPVPALTFRIYPFGSNPGPVPVAIGFDLPTTRDVRLTLFDPQGQEVRALAAGAFPAGHHRIIWDGETDGGSPAGSGVYFARIEAGSSAAQLKLILIR